MQIEAPTRVQRRRRVAWRGSPGEIFPLLCPVRETEWVEGWQPRLVLSQSGIAEQDCVFVMPGVPGGADHVWLVTAYEPPERIAFVKLVPEELLVQIEIVLAPDRGATDAQLSYTYTALSEAGKAAVAGFDEAYYEGFVAAWTEALNAHLQRLR